jgi:hypothetical protein
MTHRERSKTKRRNQGEAEEDRRKAQMEYVACTNNIENRKRKTNQQMKKKNNREKREQKGKTRHKLRKKK